MRAPILAAQKMRAGKNIRFHAFHHLLKIDSVHKHPRFICGDKAIRISVWKELSSDEDNSLALFWIITAFHTVVMTSPYE
jgi:hypothetical protein